MAIMIKAFLLVILSLVVARTAIAGDPDILTDFIVPEIHFRLPGNVTFPDGNFFTYTGFRSVVNAKPPSKFTVSKAGLAEFPALNGQSVSYAVLQYPSGTTNPPHTHPRSAELLFLVNGSLQVGFVDTTNKLFTQTLQAGDLFVFPKGLVHFQFNADPQNPALAISAFGSANAGTASLPNTLFATNIDDNVLAISFKTNIDTIKALKAGLASKP